MKNINNTDHFLLAQSEPACRKNAAALEWATIALTAVVVIGIGVLLI